MELSYGRPTGTPEQIKRRKNQIGGGVEQGVPGTDGIAQEAWEQKEIADKAGLSKLKAGIREVALEQEKSKRTDKQNKALFDYFRSIAPELKIRDMINSPKGAKREKELKEESITEHADHEGTRSTARNPRAGAREFS